MKKIITSIFMGTITISLLFSNSVSAENWILSFIERDSNSPYIGANLSIWLNDTKLYEYDVGVEGQWGYVEFNLSDYNPEGKKLKIRLNGIKTSGSRDKIGVVLKNINLTKDGKPVSFTPWIFSTNANSTFYTGHQYADNWLEMAIWGDASYHSQWESKIIESNASELEIKPWYIDTNISIYDIQDGDVIQFNVTIKNLGKGNENNATCVLSIGESSSTLYSPISSGTNHTFVFNETIDFGSSNILLVNFTVTPDNSTLEGKDSNNNVLFYLVKHRPYLLFEHYNETPLYLYNGTEPYDTWRNTFKDNIEINLSSHLNYDYCNSANDEKTKAIKLAKMALYYYITSNETYANKTRLGLECIGEWTDGFLNRSREGNVTPGSGETTNETYGMSLTTNVRTTGRALIFYAIAYDLMHNYIKSYDENYSTDSLTIVRDRLARMTTDALLLMKEYHDYDIGDDSWNFGDYNEHRMPTTAGAGMGSLALLDYLGDWAYEGGMYYGVKHPLEDLTTESKAGSTIPHVEQLLANGIKQDASYIEYFEDPGTVSMFFGFYNDALETNLELENVVVWQYLMNNFILSSLPSGWWDNKGGSTYKETFMHPCIYGSSLNNYARKWANQYCRDVIANGDDMRAYWRVNSPIMSEYPWLAMVRYDYMYSYDIQEASVLSNEHEAYWFRSNVSFEDRNQLYLWFKLNNDSAINGYGAGDVDSLTYDIYAKGAYLVPRKAAFRLGFPYLDANEDITGHAGFYFNESGEFQTQTTASPKSSRIESVSDPPKILSTITSQEIDFAHGHRYIETYRQDKYNSHDLDDPITWNRYILFPRDEYFIILDSMKSDASRVYKLIIPVGTTEIINNSATHVNQTYANGSFYIDRIYHNWWNTTTNTNITIDWDNVTEIIWSTWSEGDGGNPPTQNKLDTYSSYPVNLTIWFNPTLDIEVRTHRFHWGYFTQTWAHWISPYILAEKSNSSTNHKFVTVLYPNNENDTLPTYSSLIVTGGSGDDYASKINTSTYEDLLHISGGENISYDKVSTDAQVAFSSYNNTLNYFFLRNGSYFDYNNSDRINLTSRVGLLLANYSSYLVNINIRVNGTIPGTNMTVRVQPGYDYIVKKDGVTLTENQNWAQIDPTHIIIYNVESEYEILGKEKEKECDVYCGNCFDCETKLNWTNITTVCLDTNIINYSGGTCINNPANFINKIFDCQGLTLDGTGTGYGIYLYQTNHDTNTIKNCLITDFIYGIYFFDNADMNKIINNTIISNYYGIYLELFSENTEIIDNTINSNNYGIYLYSSPLGTTITNNNISSNNNYGIYFSNANSNTITGNTINNNGYGIYLDFISDGNIINSNTFCSNVNYDIYQDLSSNFGDSNTCDKTYNWNDNGADGCTIPCTQVFSIQYNLYKKPASTGLNLMCLPLMPSPPMTTAEDLCGLMSNLEIITPWDSMTQRYKAGYSCTEKYGNFNLIPGIGYSVSVSGNTTWTLNGIVIPPVLINLIKKPGSTGQNLICLPYNSTLSPFTAEGLCQSIPNSDAVVPWDPITQTYEAGHPCNTQVANFNLSTSIAYFVSAIANTTWMQI